MTYSHFLEPHPLYAILNKMGTHKLNTCVWSLSHDYYTQEMTDLNSTYWNQSFLSWEFFNDDVRVKKKKAKTLHVCKCARHGIYTDNKKQEEPGCIGNDRLWMVPSPDSPDLPGKSTWMAKIYTFRWNHKCPTVHLTESGGNCVCHAMEDLCVIPMCFPSLR